MGVKDDITTRTIKKKACNKLSEITTGKIQRRESTVQKPTANISERKQCVDVCELRELAQKVVPSKIKR